MFLGHIAVGLAGKRMAPSVSLGTWVLSVQLVDLLWPLFLLAGLEHVRIVPGITAFTPLDFYDYPITHSLVGGIMWGALLGGIWLLRGSTGRIAMLLGAGVLSHWVLDVISHRPDVPVLRDGPYLGLGLWNSVPATLAVELTLFAAGVAVYLEAVRAAKTHETRSDRNGRALQPERSGTIAFWLFIAFLLVTYFVVAFGPPPPDVRTLAMSGLAMWLLVPFAWWVDKRRMP